MDLCSFGAFLTANNRCTAKGFKVWVVAWGISPMPPRLWDGIFLAWFPFQPRNGFSPHLVGGFKAFEKY